MSERSSASRRTAALLLVAACVLAMMVWRRGSLHVPWAVWKPVAAMLWAGGIFWLCVALWPRTSARTLAAAACVATAVLGILPRLHTLAALDTLRFSRAGRLLLGRPLDVSDLAPCLFAIALCALAEDVLRERMERADEPHPSP